MRTVRSCALALLILLTSGFPRVLWCGETRKLDSLDLERAHIMLRQAYLDVRKNYYDPTFHGLNLDATYHRYNAALASSDSLNAAFRTIAEFLDVLQDSHTLFIPPKRTPWSAPGFTMKMVGDQCFITGIRKGSDAASKLHLGDRVLAMDGIPITRDYFASLMYLLEAVSQTRAEILLVESPGGTRRTVTIQNIVIKEPALRDLTGTRELWRLIRAQDNEDLKQERTFKSGKALIWKMPSFDVMPEMIDRVFVKSENYKSMVLDLRGNPGGRFDTLRELIASVFTHPVRLGTRVSRKGSTTEIIRPRAKPFTGRLVVLIDSQSASAAEVFARIVQLEHRGEVIGDRSAGAVMEARYFQESFGGDLGIVYGFSISSADLLLADGKSLERTGVTPDQLILPTADDLASGQDPVLARAAALAGVTLDPEAAGKLFPMKWRAL